ncbi:TPA: hypothetical protein HA251_00595 [Candidatus Woesearchaeota archaeon]|nr:hypothetical protein [Candidatus Woesearchaeota archaeon]
MDTTTTRREMIRMLGCGIVGMRSARVFPGLEFPITPSRTPYDITEYMCTEQTANDHQHIAFSGRMFDADAPVQILPYGYTKTYWTDESRKRFVTLKTNHGGPVELMGLENGRVRLFYEGMDWNVTKNNEFREHHDENGNPNYELAKIVTKPYEWTFPNISDFNYRYCDGSEPDRRVEFRRSGHYITHEVDLLRDLKGVEELCRTFQTTIDDFWAGLPKQTGLGDDPVIIVRAHHWNPLNYNHRPLPEDWGVIETYWYMKGHGLLRWQWLEHKKSDEPMTLKKELTLNTPIFEFGDNRVKHLERCERYNPQGTAQTGTTEESAIIRPSFGHMHRLTLERMAREQGPRSQE